MFYPDLSPMSMKWHVLQAFGSSHHQSHHQQQQYNGMQVHGMHQKYSIHGSPHSKQFDQFGECLFIAGFVYL